MSDIRYRYYLVISYNTAIPGFPCSTEFGEILDGFAVNSPDQAERYHRQGFDSAENTPSENPVFIEKSENKK